MQKKEEQLLTEWENFKFDKDSWKQEIPEGMNESHLETAMVGCLQRLISFKTALCSLPLQTLLKFACQCQCPMHGRKEGAVPLNVSRLG